MVEPWEEEATEGPPVPAPFERFTGDYTTFFRREVRSLVALAAAIAGADRAEEIAQEALLRAHREWDRIARYDKPGAWVRRVTINLATSSRRRRASRAPRPRSGSAPGASSTPRRPRSTGSGRWSGGCRTARRPPSPSTTSTT